MRQIDEFVWRKHALERMLERGISRAEVVAAIQNGEVVEEYPSDFPYPSCLITSRYMSLRQYMSENASL